MEKWRRVVFPFKSEGSRISFSFPRSSARSFKFQSQKFHRILPPRHGILKKTSSSQGIIFFRLKFTCHFSINQINQIVYEFWKRLTRETTPFTKSGVALLESAFTNVSIFPVSTSRLKNASDRSAFSSARSLWHVCGWCPSLRHTEHLCVFLDALLGRFSLFRTVS